MWLGLYILDQNLAHIFFGNGNCNENILYQFAACHKEKRSWEKEERINLKKSHKNGKIKFGSNHFSHWLTGTTRLFLPNPTFVCMLWIELMEGFLVAWWCLHVSFSFLLFPLIEMTSVLFFSDMKTESIDSISHHKYS